MNNLEKYDNAFTKTIRIKKEELADATYQMVDGWDSIGHMQLIAELEDVFDIIIETDDIIEFSSYEKGKKILSKNYQIEF